MCVWSEDKFMYFISPWHHFQMKLTRHSQEGRYREKVLIFFSLWAWWLCASTKFWGFSDCHPFVYIYVNHRVKNICWHIVPTSTWKSSPAPSQSFEVMTGVWICTKPFSLSWKKKKKSKHIINIKSIHFILLEHLLLMFSPWNMSELPWWPHFVLSAGSWRRLSYSGDEETGVYTQGCVSLWF